MTKAYSVKHEPILQGLGLSTKITLKNKEQAYLLKGEIFINLVILVLRGEAYFTMCFNFNII